ncbi:hypothetical protein EDB83DRAFT_370338 [Lactarius deliciosus]|nr:hypothetical protein EDB83DRAFT_370338 [Lactarius deliciosus]
MAARAALCVPIVPRQAAVRSSDPLVIEVPKCLPARRSAVALSDERLTSDLPQIVPCLGEGLEINRDRYDCLLSLVMGISRPYIYDVTGSVVQFDVCKKAGCNPRSIAGPSGQEQDCRGRQTVIWHERTNKSRYIERGKVLTLDEFRDRCLFSFPL